MIYRNELITFPNCKKEPDKGLEYDYVQDGYYEAKPKNCNVKEAERCVQLVEEHIKKHPNRSLGIIAFSEKQQSVIKDAVDDFRMNHPEYNDFFDDNREEYFFVKNLESVQGDERDTIIFSICYAKNKEGHMHMRFGPLGHVGGERRLNVAITRAKYNVKLVGSILPSDLELKNTSPEGVKLLRDYIMYAIQDDYNMPQGSSEANEDELFTDIISDFIIENGYSVKRNIGASKYKMDIAVVYPDATDEFFVGIECDGGNYIMARTARERDVLRRNIMHSIGWNIYHVWSVAWFKNPIEEKQKLIQFLKDAEQKFKIDKQKKGLKRPIYDTQREVKEEFEKIVSETETVSQLVKLEFPEYKVCNPWEAELTTGTDNITNVASRILWVMQHEQPIHKELLYKRLAPIFGREKATEPVRRTVDLAIKSRLQHKVEEKNEFLYYRNSEIRARVPVSDDDIRVIDYICDEEIKDAMVQIVDYALGLNQADLFAEAARTFKFARTGPKIKQSFARVFDDLISEEKLYEVDGKIYRKEA
jgi:very-short-patch-repair endonuclease